jgi:uncharacterized protein YegP (UPF0339 family)
VSNRLEVYESDDGWRWRCVAANGEIVAAGEAHTREHDAVRAAKSLFPDLPVVADDDPWVEGHAV